MYSLTISNTIDKCGISLGMELDKGLFGVWQNLPEGVQNAATNVAANILAREALGTAHAVHQGTNDITSPIDELGSIAKKFNQSINTPKNTLNPGEIKIQVGDVYGGEFSPDEKLVRSRQQSHTLAHELGHAYNSGTEKGAKRQNSYGRGTPKQQKISHGVRLAGLAGNLDPNAGPVESIVGGAASALLDPDHLNILKEEASAWKRGSEFMKKAGVKWNPRMAGNAIAAFSTYPLTMLASGVQTGVQGYIASQVFDKGLKGIRDITDPLLHKLYPELTPEEQALTKYGYDRDKHRVVNNEDFSELVIQPRFFKKGQ